MEFSRMHRTLDIARILFQLQNETKKIISGVVEQHIQLLNATIIKEREDRMQSISKGQQQLAELQDEVRASIGNTN